MRIASRNANGLVERVYTLKWLHTVFLTVSHFKFLKAEP